MFRTVFPGDRVISSFFSFTTDRLLSRKLLFKGFIYEGNPNFPVADTIGSSSPKESSESDTPSTSDFFSTGTTFLLPRFAMKS